MTEQNKTPLGESWQTVQRAHERGQFQLTAEAIDTLGNALVEAAHVREGYAKLAWQAGVYLLVGQLSIR